MNQNRINHPQKTTEKTKPRIYFKNKPKKGNTISSQFLMSSGGLRGTLSTSKLYETWRIRWISVPLLHGIRSVISCVLFLFSLFLFVHSFLCLYVVVFFLSICMSIFVIHAFCAIIHLFGNVFVFVCLSVC